jgi:hypothetical protein
MHPGDDHWTISILSTVFSFLEYSFLCDVELNEFELLSHLGGVRLTGGECDNSLMVKLDAVLGLELKLGSLE